MSNVIKNKTLLVTGANRGIGKVILKEALNQGAAKVYAAVRKIESAESLVAEFGERVVPIRVDLEEPQSIVDAAATATDIDIVISNAGVATNTTALAGNAIEQLEYEFSINTLGLIRVAQAFAPVLKLNGGGALVQLNSAVSIKTFPQVATYSASKAASYAITQALKEDLAEQGTQVVSVHPGPIATDMARSAGFEEVADPPELVANAIFDALADGTFHVFPDTMAKQFWEGYQSYAKNFIEAPMDEQG